MLAGKLDGVPLHRVAFQVEHLAPACRGGWSVLVQGLGQDLTDAAGVAYARVRQRWVDTWAPGDKAHCVAIEIHQMTGRRFRPLSDEGGVS